MTSHLKLAAALAGLTLIGAATAGHAQTPAQAWWDRYLANAQAVKLPDGRTASLYCEGAGAPVVIMDAGLGDGGWSWRPVQDQIAAKTRVCVFDRAGYGRSSPGPMPRDSQSIVTDEVAMLKAAKIAGPYVLVGHSMASFDVRLFAFTYPKQVAGIVLVDPSADNQADRMAQGSAKLKAIASSGDPRSASCAESPRPADREATCARQLPAGTPPEVVAFFAKVSGPDYYRTMMSEVDALKGVDNDQLTKAKHSLGDIPLVVLTAGSMTIPGLTPEESESVHKVWVTMHDEIATLSTLGANTEVPGSTHYIQRDNPFVVVASIEAVVDTVRQNQGH